MTARYVVVTVNLNNDQPRALLESQIHEVYAKDLDSAIKFFDKEGTEVLTACTHEHAVKSLISNCTQSSSKKKGRE